MRYVVLLFVLAGCDSPPPVDQEARLQAERAITSCNATLAELQDFKHLGLIATVTSLKAENAALKGEVAAIKEMLARMPGAVKVPHLIAFRGIPGEEQDLGPFIDYTHAWSEKLGAYYAIGSGVGLVYESTDCTGTAYPYAQAGFDPFKTSTFGTIWQLNQQSTRIAARSQNDGKCVLTAGGNALDLTVADAYSDTRIPGVVILRANLSAEPR